MYPRYKVTLTMDGRQFGIFDRHLGGYCSLVGSSGEEVPLRWITKFGARAWLNQCYRAWWDWEKSLPEMVPSDWKPPREDSPSPFDRGLHGYQDL